jgi:predicted MPP superfamily phosphohydrolase
MVTYNFQLISDIHLEFGACKDIPICSDYLILAGDIGYPEQKLFTEFLRTNSKKFKKIFYVAGNHEYYQNWKKNKNMHLNSFYEINDFIDKTIKNISNNIYFLNNNYYDFDDKLRIIGSTLWSDIKPYSSGINDMNQIYINNKILIDNDFINNIYKNNVDFIKEEIIKANKDNKKLLVITHHLPTYDLILPKYEIEKYNSSQSHFASNLNYLINEPIKIWCAGHSHGFNHKNINGVNCYVNAFGYSDEDRNGSKLNFTFNFDL